MIRSDRTLSVKRHEDKYLIPLERAKELQKRLALLCREDSHNTGTNGYKIRSLYFDDPKNGDFEDKLAGIAKRKKIRLRIYDEKSETVKLEVKEKQGDLQRKISCFISKEEAQQLIRGNLSALSTRFPDSKEAISIYLHINSGGQSRPVVLIEYDRLAYTLPCNETRITIDKNVRCAEYYYDLFASSPPYRYVLAEYAVLEVKYNGCLVSPVADLLSHYHLTQCAVSKYCLGRPLYYDYLY